MREAAQDNTYHSLLGIVEPKSDATTAAVVAREPNGTEVQAAMTSPENVQTQAAELQAQHPQTTVGVESPEQVIADRLATNSQQVPPDAARERFIARRGEQVPAAEPADVIQPAPESPKVETGKPTEAKPAEPTPPAEPSVARGEAKEPWQMTRDEYAKQGEISYSAPRGSGAHRDAVEDAFNRGEKLSPEVLQDYPWLAAREAIKPYVESLHDLSDKELKAEAKKTTNDLNAWANKTPNIIDGRLNPELGSKQALRSARKCMPWIGKSKLVRPNFKRRALPKPKPK